MSVSKEQVEKFINLYRQKFGEEMSYEVAYEKLVRLVRIMEIVLKNKAKNTSF